MPDQLGGILKPDVTIPGEAIHGMATAYMQIARGVVDVVTVEAHSKGSNVLTLPYITAYAMDPVVKLKGSTGGLVHYRGEVDPGDVYVGLEVEPIFKHAVEREGSILDIEYFRPVDA